MAQVKVSIVITSYNHDDFLEECIKSAINQSYSQTELLIIDDASEDKSRDIIEKYSNNFSKVLLLKENHGACIALNKILKFCRGDYVAILNSDDYWQPNKVQLQVDYLEANEEKAAVFSKALVVDENGNQINQQDSPFEYSNLNRFDWLRKFFESGNCLCHSSVLLRKSVFSSLGYYDERFKNLPDFEFWVRFSEKFTFHILPINLVFYRKCNNRQSESSLSIPNYNRGLFETELILEHYIKLDGIKKYLKEIFNLQGSSKKVFLEFGLLALNQGLFSHRNFGLRLIFENLDQFNNGSNIQTIKELHKYIGNSHALSGMVLDYQNLLDEQAKSLIEKEENVVNPELVIAIEKISRMQSSFSWKITSPLRFFRRMIVKRVPLFDKLINSPSHTPTVQEKINEHNGETTLIISEFEFKPFNFSQKLIGFNSNSINIDWLIPDFHIGSGGHTTIFRIIYHLEQMGHESKIWICGSTHFNSLRKARNTIRSHFFPLNANVEVLDNPRNQELLGDCVFSTSFETCYYSRSIPSHNPRFYLVQDYEPFFSAIGSRYFLAEQTYKFGFHCITAGKWLQSKVNEAGALTEGFFELAVDHSIFFPTVSSSETEVPKVAVYSRAGTERRLSEMVIHGLNILHKRGVKFEVLFFGSKKIPVTAQFPHSVLGVIAPRKLAQLYRSANIGMVFSATNYSLVPLEMMACGLPVVEFDGENTRQTYPKDTVEFSSPSPDSVANTVETLFQDRLRREQLKQESAKFIQSLDWEKSVKSIEGLIKQRLEYYCSSHES